MSKCDSHVIPNSSHSDSEDSVLKRRDIMIDNIALHNTLLILRLENKDYCLSSPYACVVSIG